MASPSWQSDRVTDDGGRNWQNTGHWLPLHGDERPLLTAGPPTLHHHRTRTEAIPRPVQTPTRWRSNTTVRNFNAAASARPSLEIGSRPSDRRSVSMSAQPHSDNANGLTQSLKSKASRLLRRQASSGNLTSLKTIDWSDELDDSPWETPSLTPKTHGRKLSKASPSPEVAVSPIRYNISLPFDFRHLTHTNHEDFEEMQDTPSRALRSEFSTHQASQAPRAELQGIRAETISRQSQIPETSPSTSALPSRATSRPTTPRRPSDGARPSPQIPPRPEFPWGQEDHAGNHTPSISSPSHPGSPRFLYTPEQTAWPSPTLVEAPPSPPISPVSSVTSTTPTDEDVDLTIPHAVTTPDDGVRVLQPPPFEMVRTELSRVVEEDEMSERRSSMATLTCRPSTADSSLRHVKSFPNTAQQAELSRNSTAESYRQSIQTSPRKQRRSFRIIQPSFDDINGDVPHVSESQRYSATVKDVDGDWDDVIDWCYDNKAEADCNFDFVRAASPAPEGQITAGGQCQVLASSLQFSAPTPEKKGRRSSSVYSASPPLLSHIQTTAVPDLEPTSAISAQSSFESELATPDSAYPNLDPRFPLFGNNNTTKPNFSKPNTQHSPHVSSDQTSPDLYDSLCRDSYSRDSWQFGRIDGSTISSASERSSRSQISKSSSQESFSLRHNRRSGNNSQGSLPELVPSHLSRELTEPISEDHEGTSHNDDSGRRKSPSSLVKDVAQKNLITKLQNGTAIEDACSAEVPLPLHPALRSASTLDNSDARAEAERKQGHRSTLAPSILRRESPMPRPNVGQRMRSASSATSLKGSTNLKSVNISPRASRASYGLYPANERR